MQNVVITNGFDNLVQIVVLGAADAVLAIFFVAIAPLVVVTTIDG